MAFCTSCGEEIPPGSKFCENCGAPAGQPPASPAPVEPVPVRPPLVPSPVPAKPVPVLLIAGILVIVAVVAAAIWFVGLPYLKNAGTGAEPAPVPTPVPTSPAVTLAPTMPLETPEPRVTTAVTVRVIDPRYRESYDRVYTLDQFFAYGQKVTFAHELETPPLFIKFNLTPVMVTKQKVINIGLSTEETINITYANPNAWFEVKVLDAGNGAVIETQGYGKEYPDMTRHEFMIRNPGNYVVEMSGNEVTAEIDILQGKS